MVGYTLMLVKIRNMHLQGEMVMQIYFHILITMEKFGFCTVIV